MTIDARDRELAASGDFVILTSSGVKGSAVLRFLREAGLEDALVRSTASGRSWCPAWAYLLGLAHDSHPIVDALLFWRTAQRAAADPELAEVIRTVHALGGNAAVAVLVAEAGARGPRSAQGAGT